MSASRWENLLWPRWLPETARMPLVAQISGAVALTALLMGPWWSRVSTPAPASNSPTTSAASSANVAPPAVPTAAPGLPERPAHLNLDVRHSFGSVALLVTVDGKRVLETRLEGSGKKFKMFGKRAERGFTRTLDLEPGVRIVRVRVYSLSDRFDQTRVERFELGSAQVAAWRITADESGLTAAADRPPAAVTITGTPATTPVQSAATATTPVTSIQAAAAPTSAATQQQADALADLLNTLRSMLIGIAGFVATTSAGFVLEQFLSAKKRMYVDSRRNAPGDVISTP